MINIKTVTVVGANGTMGGRVSAIFASFGNAKVYMVSRSVEKSQKAIEKACKSVRADSIRDNMIPVDYSMLDQCVSDSDLIFESTAESFSVKREITKKIAIALQEGSVVCTGTSGLSITKLAELFPEKLRERYMGIHFFNPPYSMTLCEVTPTIYTDVGLFADVKQYLKQQLFRTVVEVKDSPAFLANRIGFYFINEAFRYAQQYKDNGGIDYIDSILGSFTGRSMPPLATADFVGLDVHKAIVDNIYNNTNDYAHESFALPDFVQKLIEDGHLGKKSGGGIYQDQVYESGVKRKRVYDIGTGTFRDKLDYIFPFAERMKLNLKTGDYQAAFQVLINNTSNEAAICMEFLLKYILYSLNTAGTVGYSINSADDVMATGFNWCPPLAMYHAFAAVTDVKALIKERIEKDVLEAVDMEFILESIKDSKYDYRQYFKAR